MKREDMPFIPALLALMWHGTDAALSFKKHHPRARKFVAGVGIGWSAFWVTLVLLGKARMWYNNRKNE